MIKKGGERVKALKPHPLVGMEDLQEVDNTETDMSVSQAPKNLSPGHRDSVVFKGANMLSLTLFDKEATPNTAGASVNHSVSGSQGSPFRQASTNVQLMATLD